MTLQGIQKGEVSKQFQMLNEVFIPGHRQQTGQPGEELFAEFQNVLDKIAVALTSDGEGEVLEGMLTTETPPAAARIKEKQEFKEEPKEEEQVVTEETAEPEEKQAKGSEAVESEEEASNQEETEETEASEDTVDEQAAAEEEATEEASGEAVVGTEVSAAAEVIKGHTDKVDPKAAKQDTEKVESTEVEEVTLESFNGKGQQSNDAELAKAARQLAEAKQEMAVHKKGAEEAGDLAKTTKQSGEQVDEVVKQFMESLRGRLQKTVEEQPAYAKPADGATTQTPAQQQNAAAILSQLIIKNATQNGGEASKGLNNALQNVIAATTKADGSKNEKSEGAKATEQLARNFKSRTLAKVEEALKEVARSKDGKTISVRLDPPSLGKVKVDVSVRDGVLHARLQADSSQVTSLLREHGLDLQYALRKLGLNVDEVTVTVTPDQGEREAAFENFTEQGGSNGNNQDMQEEQSATNGTSNDGTEATPNVEEADDHWVA